MLTTEPGRRRREPLQGWRPASLSKLRAASVSRPVVAPDSQPVVAENGAVVATGALAIASFMTGRMAGV